MLLDGTSTDTPEEIGKPRYRVHANGRVYATAQMRDLAGKLHTLSGAGFTEADTLAELQRKSRTIAAVGRGERLHAGRTHSAASERMSVEIDRITAASEAAHALAYAPTGPRHSDFCLSSLRRTDKLSSIVKA